MTEEQKKASEDRITNAARTMILGAGSAAAATGHPVEAGLIFSLTTEVINAAKAFMQNPTVQKLQDFTGSIGTWRIAKTFHNIGSTVEAEGISLDAEHVMNLLEQTIPFVANASTEEKRQMMEDIIRNGVRKSEGEFGHIEAKSALKRISDMPDEVAVVFSAFVAQMQKQGPGWPIPNPGLSDVLHDKALTYLRSDPPHGVELLTRSTNSGGYDYTREGRWLADWITNNPAPKPPAKEATEPT